jgi:hypothetical protein
MEQPPQQVLRNRKGESGMKTLTMNDERILGIHEETANQEIVRAKSSSWWKHFLGEVSTSLAAPFQADWDNKCGFHWREWGKL